MVPTSEVPYRLPPEYLAEHVRDAIVREAHELGIIVTISDEGARLEGRTETEKRRLRIEDVARGVLGDLPIFNCIEVVPPNPASENEELS
jgi:hypothetical protein